MDNLTPVFILLTGIAVALQAGVLLAMFLTMRKSSARMEAIATEVKTKVLPVVEQAQALMVDVRPRLQVIAANLEETTATLRDQVKRVDATVDDVVDRTRLQIIRGDELLSRTLDRVEQTSELVHRTVISPVRQLSGLMQGITVALDFLFSSRARRNGTPRDERRAVPQDEMFI
jgi:methyl-accepting chemotaxis protein